jgi:ergothioneine biosynthesis protein EgtB
VLFNSYYNSLGPKHPRPQRGLLTRPPLAEIYAYRRNIDQRMQRLLETIADEELQQLVILGLNHEQQHQELILTDIKHLLAQNPLHPAYTAEAATSAPSAQTETTLSIAHYSWHQFSGGVVEIGHAGDGFCFDNETPRHSVYLQPYQLAAALVTNGEYLQFVEAGAYTRPGLWLSEGWDWVVANQRTQPLYWHKDGEHWQEFTLDGMVPLVGNAPLRHISYYEAEAYARWINARLPTEAEWEHAAATHELLQGQDTAWQWTQSSYAPYPGYQAAAGAIGEYNGKFMVNQYVLRGGSSATPDGHTRITYRNFFPAHACWQFSGIRLARDLIHPA